MPSILPSKHPKPEALKHEKEVDRLGGYIKELKQLRSRQNIQSNKTSQNERLETSRKTCINTQHTGAVQDERN